MRVGVGVGDGVGVRVGVGVVVGARVKGLVRVRVGARVGVSEGRTILTPCAESCDMIFCDATMAAWRTGPAVSATDVSSSGRIVITYGSKSRPSAPARHS